MSFTDIGKMIPAACAAAVMAAATPAPAQEVSQLKVMVPGPSLEGNLEGNETVRDLIVFLPPSYEAEPDRHYPVVYALHGYSIDNDIWTGENGSPATIERAFADGAKEMIVVMPDTRTVHNGSMYSSSVTTGDWESYIAEDIVSYVDGHYRTIPTREARGLAGHSMGGYGTLRIGMKRPDVFSALYAMSPCCLAASDKPADALLETLRALEAPEDSFEMSFFERATLASAAAWSPNPTKPPFYFDLPGDEDATSPVMARWAANAPTAMADQYMVELRQYDDALAIDIGDQDWLLPGAKLMDSLLSANDIGHSFEIYEGDHVNRVAERFEDHVIPFFSEKLAAER